jgi:hypothetical protein
MVSYAHAVYVTCYFCYMFSLLTEDPPQEGLAVFGYTEV